MELSRVGGLNVKEVTRRIMYKIFTNEVGILYSWEGAKKKKVFKNLAIASVILGNFFCIRILRKDFCFKLYFKGYNYVLKDLTNNNYMLYFLIQFVLHFYFTLFCYTRCCSTLQKHKQFN